MKGVTGYAGGVTFSREQLDRYSRQLLLPGVGAAGQRKLLEAKVLVVGAGGLGSPALLYLAAAGVGTLGIVDDDAVALSNLQRQVLYTTRDLGEPKVSAAARRLRELNSDVRLEPHPVRLTEGNAGALVAPYDLVLDGSDNLETRYRLSDACVGLGKPLLYGALSQFEGQLSLLHAPTPAGPGPCYRCLYPEAPPGGAPSCAAAGVFGALPGTIGSLMAVEAIKYLVGLGASLAGTLLHYDALDSSFRRVRLARDPHCASCGDGRR
ncbi:UBA/THIF-type NAD/FAD binding protein [Truepera radiovictrix DSM 17093]|uniref:UBA/THIF-type NAD/FAD binding protein n=1 Tax=Truepera radiovictrix (strain DSM 17093 / CIP 108686 / LMG 22925 / RQ-24) TaxID=649638 RepID=D7CVM9_TRURR|nr:UBA/THIF-type NAD/FAD binding protein [Truepera radiovictrix DSM 17093]